MSNIYDKIFPILPIIDDTLIYHNSFKLDEPNNLLKNDNYIFDNFLLETKELLIKLNLEKCPLQKLDCIINLSQKIKNSYFLICCY